MCNLIPNMEIVGGMIAYSVQIPLSDYGVIHYACIDLKV